MIFIRVKLHSFHLSGLCERNFSIAVKVKVLNAVFLEVLIFKDNNSVEDGFDGINFRSADILYAEGVSIVPLCFQVIEERASLFTRDKNYVGILCKLAVSNGNRNGNALFLDIYATGLGNDNLTAKVCTANSYIHLS